MKQGHLNDDDIQEILYGEAKQDLTKHLLSCSRCRQATDSYKLLFDQLIQQEVPAFDMNISEVVLARLQAGSTGMRVERSFAIFVIGVTSLVCVAFFYFLGPLLFDVLSAMSTYFLIFIASGTMATLLSITIIDFRRKMQLFKFT